MTSLTNYRLQLTLPEEETEVQGESADEEGWLERVGDLWDKHLPHLRRRQSAGLLRPNADQYGFQQDREVVQTEKIKLGAAIMRGIEEKPAEPILVDEQGEEVGENCGAKGERKKPENCKVAFINLQKCSIHHVHFIF